MDMLQIVKSIVDIGFSLFVAVFLLVRVDSTMEALKSAINALSEEIKVMKGLRMQDEN